jgi:hypothetical protein
MAIVKTPNEKTNLTEPRECVIVLSKVANMLYFSGKCSPVD